MLKQICTSNRFAPFATEDDVSVIEDPVTDASPGTNKNKEPMQSKRKSPNVRFCYKENKVKPDHASRRIKMVSMF